MVFGDYFLGLFIFFSPILYYQCLLSLRFFEKKRKERGEAVSHRHLAVPDVVMPLQDT